MKVDVEAKVKQIMEEAAAREGLTPEQYREKHRDRKPRFLQAYERLAERTGKSVQQLMDEDLERVRNSRWPGPDCLDPSECERTAMPEDRIDHMRGCPDCYAMWASTHGAEPGEFPAVEEPLPPVTRDVEERRNNPWPSGLLFLGIFVIAALLIGATIFALAAIVSGFRR